MRCTGLIFAAATCLTTVSACGQAPTTQEGSAPATDAVDHGQPQPNSSYGERIRARLIDGNGERIGEIFAWQGVEGVILQLRIEYLPPGWHSVHLHGKGDCSDIGAFKASGGHIEGQGGPHGFLHPDGAHGGDLPNIHAHADGSARVDFFTASVALTDLTDSDGAALIVHAVPDDYQTQPIGGAGARIACAAFGE